MKIGHLLIITFLVLLAFVVGYQANSFYSNKTDVPKEQKKDTVFSTEKEIIVASTDNKIDYSKKLSGKFVLESADYAGFEFIDSKTISWTNEMFPMDPDTMSLKWVSKDIFVAIFNKTNNKENCPPSNWVRKVEYYDGKKLVLKNIWTGWGEYKDTTEAFTKE